MSRILRRSSAGSVIVFIAAMLLLAGCDAEKSPRVGREQLFTLGYGQGEDQLDLFQLEDSSGPLKTRITMREGIFYISNGNGAKVLRLSSFGDVLSMIYNAERNPEPLLLKQTQGAEAAGRRAVPYPFKASGEIAVSSKQIVYVEDRLPPERRVYDQASNSILDYAVLRFDGEGRFLDYLGQEGVGGTPFPYIVGLYLSPEDDCIVVSVTQVAWLVHWFDSRGLVRQALTIKRDALPPPPGSSGLIASLDRIVPDSSSRALILKVDYYKESVDPQTKSGSGIDYAGSWAYRMDPSNGSFVEKWEIPAIEKTVKSGSERGSSRYVRIPEFLGSAGDRLFFVTADDDGKTYLSVFDRSSRGMTRYAIDIAPDELYYTSLYLSPDGILCALLGTKYEARVVWWRFDKLFGAAAEASTASK